jgi:hypothetical protein
VKRILVLLLAAGLVARLDAQGTEPLRKTDLIRLLSNAMIRKGEIADLVRRNCLTFRPTERDWADLRNLGADADVMSSIGGCGARAGSRAGGTQPRAPAAPAPGPAPGLVLGPAPGPAPRPAAEPAATPTAAPPAALNVTSLPGRVTALAGADALLRVGVRRGDTPQRGVTLTLRGSANSSGGPRRVAQAVSDDSGLVVFRVPAGRLATTYHFEVVSGGGFALPGRPTLDLVVRASRPAVADVRPARVELGGAQEGAVTVQVAVRDSFGNAVPNEPLELRPERADLGVAAETRAADSLGRVAFVIETANVQRPGRLEVRARGERLGVLDVVLVNTAAGAGSGFQPSSGQRGGARTLLSEPLVFQARTPSGRPLPGRVVVFRARNAQLARDSAVTDSVGRARVDVTLGSRAGPAVVTASLDSVQAAETLAVDPGPAVELILERDGARVDGGRIIVERDVPFALTLKARDGYGNLIPTVSLARTLQDVLRQYNARSQLLRFVGVQSDSLTATLKFKPIAIGTTDLTIAAGLTASVSVEVVRPRR